MGLISRVSSRTYRKMLRQSLSKIFTRNINRNLRTSQNLKAIVDVESEDDFKKYVSDAKDRTVIVDFHADWCGPCRMLTPILKKAEADYDDLDIVKINVDDADPALPGKFQVSSIPLVLFFKNGEFKHQKVGAFNKQYLDDALKGLDDL